MHARCVFLSGSSRSTLVCREQGPCLRSWPSLWQVVPTTEFTHLSTVLPPSSRRAASSYGRWYRVPMHPSAHVQLLSIEQLRRSPHTKKLGYRCACAGMSWVVRQQTHQRHAHKPRTHARTHERGGCGTRFLCVGYRTVTRRER